MAMKGTFAPLSVDEARHRILQVCSGRRIPTEFVALEMARRRVVMDDIRAMTDLPPFANSAMDGFALQAADLPSAGTHRLRIVGARLAGSSGELALKPGECLRITTGAVLPDGADTVVAKERVQIEGDFAVFRAGESTGAYVRPAGEDFRAGDTVVRGGDRITFARMAAIASLGLHTIEVSHRPRVALMTTGDELVMPGDVCSPAQIYNSNGYSLSAMVAMSGAQVVVSGGGDASPGFVHVGDEPTRIRDALLAAAAESDVVITSGGVSAGEADFLPSLMEQAGRIHFWKVRMRPGMPFLFGEIGNALVFCLPGNPVSTMATFLCLVQPALAALEGSSEVAPKEHPARLEGTLSKQHDRAEFVRGRFRIDNSGAIWVSPMAQQGSAMLHGVIDANCLIVVPESTQTIESGATVQIMPFPESC
jgi:molybdopterin molybdotransferase